MNDHGNNHGGAAPADDNDARAAEYVLGVLDPAERDAFAEALEGDARLRSRVAFWQDHFLGMAEGLAPLAPSEGLFATIEAAVDGKPQPGSVTVRADEGEWQELFEGVFKKNLLVDEGEGAESFLLRIEAGAVCPAHSHTKTEECLVLEGEMIIGEAHFAAGDYHAAPPAIPHLPITSKIGALLYVRSELHA